MNNRNDSQSSVVQMLEPERQNTLTWGERVLPRVLLLALSLSIVWGFIPEVGVGELQFSDATLHLAMLQQLDATVKNGGSPFDFWFDASPFGYALFRSYQHLPHLIMYGLYRLSGETIPLPSILPLTTLLLASILPWSFFWSARILGFSAWQAAAAGIFSALLTEQGGYGLSLLNYTWGNYGIITQLWAIVFLTPAIALGIKGLKEECSTGYFAAFSFLAVGSHLLAGYVIFGTLLYCATYLCVTKTVEPRALGKRLLVLIGLFLLVTAHQWVFIALDSNFIHRSIFEPEWKFAARGVAWTIKAFFSGGLFDGTRIPVVTASLLIGGAIATALIGAKGRANRDTHAILVLLGLVVWISILCGYQLWGWLFESLPLLNTMHLHRFIVPVQICGVLLAGYGIGRLLVPLPSSLLKSGILVLVAFIPLNGLKTTFNRSQQHIATVRQAKAEVDAAQRLLEELSKLPRAWLHAGMQKSWATSTRIAGLAPLYHLSVARGIPTMGMLFHSMSLAGDSLFDFDPYREDHYRLFGVTYSISPKSLPLPPFLETIAEVGEFRLSRHSTAQLLSVEDLRFEGWGTPEKTVQFSKRWINSSLPEHHVYGEIVQQTVSGARLGVPFASGLIDIPPAAAEPPGVVRTQISASNNHISAAVSAVRPGIVVYRTSYHRNWKAFIDGVEHTPIQVIPGYLAVKIDPGEHHVSFEYFPSQVKPWLLLLAILSIGTLIWRAARQKHQPRSLTAN